MEFTDKVILSVSFFTGLGVTFFYNYMTAWFISEWHLINSSVAIASVLLSILQCICCLIICDTIPVFWNGKNENIFRSVVKITSHFGTTLLYNASFIFLEPSSAMTIKLLDCFTAALGQRIFQKIALNWIIILSLPIMVCGALIFTNVSTDAFHPNIGSLLAFLSNILLTARNIVISMEFHEKGEMKLRSGKTIAMCVLCVLCATCLLFYLELYDKIPRFTSLLFCLALFASIFGVSSTYINTFVLLKRLTVVTASVWCTVKRITVVLMLYCVGSRHATVFNFTGLVICYVGIALYQYGKFVKNTVKEKQISKDFVESEITSEDECKS